MEYRQLGLAGIRVSVAGIGTNRFGSEALPEEEVKNVIDQAQDPGINFLDAATSYQQGHTDEEIGKALKER